eukprot:5931904-Prorocentrum_lima.AAC.1
MTSSLVGSEMCIRDSLGEAIASPFDDEDGGGSGNPLWFQLTGQQLSVSYTHLTLPTICSV